MGKRDLRCVPTSFTRKREKKLMFESSEMNLIIVVMILDFWNFGFLDGGL